MTVSRIVGGALRATFSWISALPEPEARRSLRSRLMPWILMGVLALAGVQAALWAATVLPGGQTYSQQQVANMFANSSNPYLASNASTFAAMSHNVEDANGSTGTYNGSCCTGLMQLNGGNLTTYCGCDRAQFATMSGQQQIDVYTRYFNSIQNSSQIKQLEAMQSSGQTLGGNPVTGATIAACAQLGTGNCQKAINSGCGAGKGNGADGNGSTICSMAAKATGGKVVAPNGDAVPSTGTPTPATATAAGAPTTPSTTPPSSASVTTGDLGVAQQIGGAAQDFTPEQAGAAGSMMGIGDPTFCWICDGALYSLGIVETVVSTASPQIVQTMWPLMVTLAALSVALVVGAAMVGGGDPFRAALKRLGRIAVVLALFTGGVIQPLTSSSSSSPILDYVVSPPLTLGATIGSDLMAASATAFGLSLPSGNCVHDTLDSTGVKILADAGNAVVKFACDIHQAAAVSIQVGGILITHPHTDESKVEIGAAFILAGIGLLVMATTVMALINFGFAFIEAILKIGVVVAFLPVFVFAWIFDATKGMTKVVLDSMAFSFFYMIFTGVCASVMVFVFMRAFQFGLGNNGGSIELSAAVSTFDQLAAGQGLTTAAGFASLVQFACFTAAGALLGGRMLQAGHDLALEVSEFGIGERGALAQVGSKLVSRGVGIASLTAGLGANVVGKGLGSLAGSAAGGGVGRGFRKAAGQVGRRTVWR